LEAADEVKEKTKIYLPFNILPLDPDSGNQALMKLPEVSFSTLPFYGSTLLTCPSKVFYGVFSTF
jgi:hypothetical protein